MQSGNRGIDVKKKRNMYHDEQIKHQGLNKPMKGHGCRQDQNKVTWQNKQKHMDDT